MEHHNSEEEPGKTRKQLRDVQSVCEENRFLEGHFLRWLGADFLPIGNSSK
jgi:hypothetical protein